MVSGSFICLSFFIILFCNLIIRVIGLIGLINWFVKQEIRRMSRVS
jgi:hypothetical protein